MRLFIVSTILILTLAACSENPGKMFKPETPAPSPTNTPFFVPTKTTPLTETPTPSPTATTTITPSPTPSTVIVEAGNVAVPILLYHHVNSESINSRYNIDPLVFEKQMKWLYDNQYKTITISDLVSLILKGGQMPIRPVVITFDDGNLDVYQNAYPIMESYGFIATFYIVNQYINGASMISIDQVKELIEQGWEIGSHSEQHTDLTAKEADLETQIRLSKLHMQDRLGITINSFAYPFGKINEQVIDKTIRSGYISAAGLGEGYMHGRFDLFYLIRMEVQSDYPMDRFISLLPWSGPIQ